MAFVGNGEIALFGDFGGVGTEFDQFGGGSEGFGVGTAVAKGAGIGGEPCKEAGGGSGIHLPLCQFEKLEEDAGGGGDIGDD